MKQRSLHSLQTRLLAASSHALAPILAIGFVLSYFHSAGAIVLIAIAAWHLTLNWRSVIHSKWALYVISTFGAIALKDLILFALGNQDAGILAKSASRVFMLAGAAALVRAYGQEELERVFGRAFTATAVAMTVYWILLVSHYRLAWPAGFAETLQRNVPGQLSIWLPLLALLSVFRLQKGRLGLAGSAIFIAGEIYLTFLASSGGWRLGPVAFAAAGLLLALKRRVPLRISATGLLAVSILALWALVFFNPSPINDKLFYRIDLWRGYTVKAMDRPFTGWGYTEAEDNKRLLDEELQGTKAYPEFREAGLGAHNAFIGMLFENGILALALLTALYAARVLRIGKNITLFDISMPIFILMMSTDAFTPGGVRFLGFYLGVCLMAIGRTEIEPVQQVERTPEARYETR